MELGTRPESWGCAPAEEASPLLDWHGLRARLLAGYAARRELGTDCPVQPARGSFDEEFARILNGYGTAREERLADVNPTALAVGKARGGKNQPVAGNKWPVIED